MHALRITFAGLIAALALAQPAAPATATTDSTHQLGTGPRGWSAVEGTDPAALAGRLDEYRAGDQGAPGDPYCDTAQTIAQTLSHDFGETKISDSRLGTGMTQLWGSDMMGTWTLVMQRKDDLSCVIASGIGYSSDANPDLFYAQAGLIS